MNIFVTNKEPEVAVQHLDDKRLSTMIIETAQLLSTSMSKEGVTKGPLKTVQVNDPVRQWVGRSFLNFEWTVRYFKALCDEYNYRFDKQHEYYQYYEMFDDCKVDFISEHDNENELTPFVNCTIFKEESNTFRAYREQLKRNWLVGPTSYWTKRNKPVWNE